MPAEPDDVIHQLVVGGDAAIAEIIERAHTSDDVTTMVAAALFAPVPGDLLQRAAGVAQTTRDRQVVAIAVAHVAGDADRVDALARDHLVDHPDSVLVAWISANTHPQPTNPEGPVMSHTTTTTTPPASIHPFTSTRHAGRSDRGGAGCSSPWPSPWPARSAISSPDGSIRCRLPSLAES